jgi:hypothetical protein
MSVLARQQAKVNAALVNEDELRGSVQSPEEAAALVSVAAEFSPADASEMVRASLRAVQQYGDKSAGPILAKAGIKSGMSPIEKFKRLAPVVEAEAKASGMNVNEVLRTKMGFSELEVQGVGTMLNRGVTGGLFQKRQDIADRLAGEAPTAAMIGEFSASPVGLDRIASSGVALAEMERGAENSRMETLRKQALERLVRDKRIDTTGTNIGNFVRGAIPFSQIESGNQERIMGEVKSMLDQRAKAVGTTGYYEGATGIWTSEGRNEELNNVMARIEKRGGDPLAQTEDEKRAMAEQTAVLKEIRDRLGPRNQIPPPVGGAWPAPVMNR